MATAPILTSPHHGPCQNPIIVIVAVIVVVVFVVIFYVFVVVGK